MTTVANPRTTNKVVAERLGVSVATVSRLRSGDRNPSFAIMAKIASELSWSLSRQATARQKEAWHVGFEEACRKVPASRKRS